MVSVNYMISYYVLELLIKEIKNEDIIQKECRDIVTYYKVILKINDKETFTKVAFESIIVFNNIHSKNKRKNIFKKFYKEWAIWLGKRFNVKLVMPQYLK